MSSPRLSIHRQKFRPIAARVLPTSVVASSRAHGGSGQCPHSQPGTVCHQQWPDPGASGGQAPGGGGGDGERRPWHPFQAMTPPRKRSPLPRTLRQTVNVTNGTIRSQPIISLRPASQRPTSRKLSSTARQAEYCRTELASKAYAVSGNGTLNATGVTFVQADAKTKATKCRQRHF